MTQPFFDVPTFEQLHQLPERDLPFALEEYADRLTSECQRFVIEQLVLVDSKSKRLLLAKRRLQPPESH